jgi:type IV pilus assembly protein PilB
VDFSRSLLNLVPREIAEKYCLVPIFVRRVRKQGETLYVAMDDPTNEPAIGEVARASSLAVKPMIACPSDIRAAIRVYYLGEDATEAAASGPASVPNPPATATPPVTPVSTTPPVVSTPGPKLAPAPPPPLPERARSRPDIPPSEVAGAAPPPPRSEGGRPSSPELEPRDADRALPRKHRPRMISLTLLDGTTISIPAPPKGRRPSKPDVEAPLGEVSDQLTARDLVSALRAVAHGADASEILGAEPRWEAIFSALLSILLRKGLIADWEFIEEFRKI